MRIRIVCVGRLKEKYYKEAQANYLKLLSRFASVDVVEVRDETPRSSSAADEADAREAEGRRILQQARGHVICCDPKGRTFTSEGFAGYLDGLAMRGTSEISFIIGGSTGLSPEVLARADLLVSFSAMTMPHRLFRIVLLEQVYRAFKISSGQTYHK